MTLKIDYYRPRYDHVHNMRTITDNINSILERGEKLDALIARSEDLNSESKMFYKTAKKSSGILPSFRGRTSLSSKDTIEEAHSHKTNVVNVLSTTAEAGMSSTSFAIPRRSTIDADVSVHYSTHCVILFLSVPVE